MREAIGDFLQHHAKAQVRLVAAVLSNGILIEHVRKRVFRLDPRYGTGTHHHFFDHLKNVFLSRKRHLEIELREFRLAVGAQIFVAEALDDLEVAVEATDHQNLFKDLRGLRQRVKLPVMHSAGHEIIARAFRRRAREHGRFHFEETHFVHHLANF